MPSFNNKKAATMQRAKRAFPMWCHTRSSGGYRTMDHLRTKIRPRRFHGWSSRPSQQVLFRYLQREGRLLLFVLIELRASAAPVLTWRTLGAFLSHITGGDSPRGGVQGDDIWVGHRNRPPWHSSGTEAISDRRRTSRRQPGINDAAGRLCTTNRKMIPDIN